MFDADNADRFNAGSKILRPERVNCFPAAVVYVCPGQNLKPRVSTTLLFVSVMSTRGEYPVKSLLV